MTTLTVGTGQEYATLTAAVAAAQTGDTIDVKAGTYTNDFPATINGLTIEGVGGIATFVATAQPGNGKAYLDVAGNTTLKNLDISGITVPDGNGAAIRYEGGNLVISNTAIHGNQDGLLGAADPNGTITIDHSEVYSNGTTSGSTHNLYIGDIAKFTLTNSYIHDANTGHEVKSRAETNDIENNRIEDNSSTASYGIDLPNGGNATIANNTIQKSGSSGNPISITYAEEYVAGSATPEQKLNAGTSVSITGNTFVSDRSGADVLRDTTGINFTASGNSIYNYAAVDYAGHVSSSGFTTLSSRPTLDTSSPVDRSGGSTSGGSTSTGNSGGTTTAGTTTGGTTSGGTTVTPPADTTPPTLTAQQSVSGTTTSTTNTLSGTVSDSGSGVAGVEIFETSGGRTTDLGAATLTGGTWSYTVSNLNPGTYQFYAVGSDKVGNATGQVATGPAETVVAPAVPPIAVTGLKLSSQGLTLSGTAAPNGVIALTDTLGSGQTKTLGSTKTGSDGSWSITTRTLLNPAVANTLRLTEGNQSSGAVVLASPFSDTLTGTSGKADLFVFSAITGNDVVKGFEAAGNAHDTIELLGTRFGSFDQLKSQISGATNAVIRLDHNNSITLTGVSANTLQASDFRFA